MTKLFYHPGNASMAPHCVLEEIGKPFELAFVDRAHNAHKSADYLQLNPNGLIPVLVDGDLVLYETAAICLHLADTHPDKKLAPELGTSERAQFYKWLMWLTNTLQSTLLGYFYPERWVDEGNTEGAAQIKAHAETKVNGLVDQIEAHLAAAKGPWFLGEQFSILDPYVLMLCRWTRGFTRPARNLPHIGRYLERVLARPAVQRALQAEGLQAPWV
ncbi:glutathione S-transferase family protein [Bordetella genomosp. 4]|uniref:Glutathione S-transferase n=1 Tax=Bordetella genomosp. 4 TaxID=463044 RepID=A0A261U244_9BORD|nr:glutathione S-transferase family protein [Bordetella genomosp. 4]OZI49586.1 glutathione S-transferase [Bordetella genomosp. 4]OZI56034.1 glutathione S-transferase [Bordetella genomosp. 4]